MARGRLRIYLGAAPGVGKTFAMLNEGWRRRSRGADVVIGFVETHGREGTQGQIRDMEVVPRRQIEHRGQLLDEMDLDAILFRRPAVALIDELAHSNVPGTAHEKRWQDVAALLDAGIDVVSTLNIQHLASLNDSVERITGVRQRETVPDAIVRAADQIELVDMDPEALRRRMAHGSIYPAERVDTALARYFRAGNLSALRELALLWVADRVDSDLAAYRQRHGITQPWETKERVVVALAGGPGSEQLLRRGARMAARVNGELIGVHVRATDGFARATAERLDADRELLTELGGRYAEAASADIGAALVSFAKAENATQLVIGATRRSRWREMLHGSIVSRVVRDAAPIDVHVISESRSSGRLPASPRRRHLTAFPPRRRHVAWVLGTAGMATLGAGLSPLRSTFGLAGACLFLLLGVVGVATLGGVPPAMAAIVVGAVSADFFFTEPYHELRIARWADVLAVAAFVAVAGAVSALVERLARRGLQVARAQAEAEALARLAGGSVLAGARGLPDLVAELRRTFDLDGVAILVPDPDGEGEGWLVAAAAGSAVPTRPEAPFAAELDDGAVLVWSGVMLNADDTRLLAAFVAQLRQVQERTRLEAGAASAAELAEANSVRSALLAAVSHDLRTPLTSIKAAATSLLSTEVAWTPEQAKGLAQTIDAESDRLTQLVSNLLDMSRLQTGALPLLVRPCAVEGVLYQAVASLGSAAAAVVIDVPEQLPQVDVDPGLLERALANVIDNAAGWSPPGSAVRVEAGAADGRVDVRVIDQGPGIPVAQRGVVFEPFQRLGDRAGGSLNGIGLGLAVAKGFVEALGGSVSIDDTPGGGATFVLSLPQAQR